MTRINEVGAAQQALKTTQAGQVQETKLNSIYDAQPKTQDTEPTDKSHAEEIANLKPETMREFMKPKDKMDKLGDSLGYILTAGTSSLNKMMAYALERHDQSKDIDAIQEGLSGKTLYCNKREYKKAIKQNPELAETSVLIRSKRFKDYVANNENILFDVTFQGKDWYNYFH